MFQGGSFLDSTIILSTLIPFAGTALGAAAVFFLRKAVSDTLNRCMSGFAAGVMIAASVWSLLIPAIEQGNGAAKMIPVAGGFWIEILFLLLMDRLVPHIHPETMEKEGPASKLKDQTMLLLAVTLHNVPEGMAVGALVAASMAEGGGVPLGMLALAIGIAIQNAPEGAIISMPLHASGMSKSKAFLFGTLSGAVEPIAAWITIALHAWIAPMLPWFLSSAAGAMMYVVVEELIPEMACGKHSNWPAIAFGFGFTIMMILDIVMA